MNLLANSLLAQSLTQATTALSQFAAQPDFLEKLRVAFGDSFNPNFALGLRNQFQSGDFSLIPELRVLTNGELGTANGAYAGDLDRIFVSAEFLAKADVAAVSELLLEEIGHKLDRVLNSNVDSPGDEGAIFRLLATGFDLSAQTLAGLRGQDDHAVIVVDGQSVNVENQSFTGTNGNDTLIGTSGDDSFYPLKGADSIDGGAGTDYLAIDNSTDTVDTTINYTTVTNGTITGGSNDGTTFKNIEVVDIRTGSGNDNINVSATTGEDSLGSSVYAGAGNDTIIGSLIGPGSYYGGSGNDTLTGGSGNENFNPGTGVDNIDGGGGNNSLYITNSTDTVANNINYTTLTNGTITGGSNDGTTFKNIEYVDITTGSGSDNINVSAATAGFVQAGAGNDTIVGSLTGSGFSYYGGDGNDIITGGNGDSRFYGEVGNDTLIGGSGNESFDPGTGADNIDGGGGTDTLKLDDSSATVGINVNYTTVTNGTITGGSSNGTTFKNIEGTSIKTGSGNDNINISAAAGGLNYLSGGSGNDTYTIDRTTNGGTTIRDSSGTNDKLTLVGGTSLTAAEISREGTDLLIDLNKDGVFDVYVTDLSINNFFASTTGSAPGTGFIETLDTLSGSTIINTYAPSRNDFNGDGKSDILWRNTDGSIATWQMNGSTATPKSVGSLTNDWQVAGTGDFNGDKTADILWRNSNGNIATWQINNSTVTTSATIGNVTSDWQIAGTGDFNGDGKSDILWRNNDGSVATWQMNGGTVASAAAIGTATSDWKFAGTGDLNGDGQADIVWSNSNDGRVALWQMNGTTANAVIIGTNSTDWKIVGKLISMVTVNPISCGAIP